MAEYSKDSSIQNDRSPRVIIIDDNEAIHDDFAKILAPAKSNPDLDAAEAAFFGEENLDSSPEIGIELAFAHQGKEGCEKVKLAVEEGQPFALAFVDMRMPPGWDGLKTIQELWKVDPNIQVVICTAYSDHTWADLIRAVGNTDQLLILKKPFDNIEVCQLTLSLTKKWALTRQANLNQAMLEEQVEERTTELREAERCLRQQQKMEALGSMVGGVAHEFNNLLQVIGGYTEFALSAIAPASQPAKDLLQVVDATERAAQITDQLLSFGRKRVSTKTFGSINNVLDATEHLIKPMVGESIELCFERCEDSVEVLTDQFLLSQVLLNLCINARDAMDAGGRLTVKAEQIVLAPGECVPGQIVSQQPSEGCYAMLSVMDTGTGISQEILEKIFEPFFTTKEAGKGTGLGLAVAYGAIQDHDGFMTIESQLGAGTTFRILLPAVESRSIQKSLAAPQPTARPTTSSIDGERTILLAEDEPLVREVGVRLLENASYEVLAAADGQEAVELFEEHAVSIDAVMLDAKMPRLNGHEAYQRIRELNPEIKILFCTGYDPKPEQLDLDNPNTFLAKKPISPDALLTYVKSMFDDVQCDARGSLAVNVVNSVLPEAVIQSN